MFRRLCVGAAATDVLFDGVKPCDALERPAGDRRRAGGGKFVEAAPDMGPAKGELHVAAFSKHPVTAIAVNLQDALEAGEMSDRPLGLAIRRIDVGEPGGSITYRIFRTFGNDGFFVE